MRSLSDPFISCTKGKKRVHPHCTKHFWKCTSECVTVPSTFQTKLMPAAPTYPRFWILAIAEFFFPKCFFWQRTMCLQHTMCWQRLSEVLAARPSGSECIKTVLEIGRSYSPETWLPCSRAWLGPPHWNLEPKGRERGVSGFGSGPVFFFLENHNFQLI